jgi:ParB/RepB/Spo0J family partition protein
VSKSKKGGLLRDFSFKAVDPYGAQVATAVEAEQSRINIDLIRPDPGQPRRFLPEELTQQLVQGIEPRLILKKWLSLAENAATGSAVRQAVLQLRALADSIESVGLINPITVRRDPDRPEAYIIVTGERRWWAHTLLQSENRPVAEHDYPDQIQAAVVPDKHVRAVQIIENLHRADLSLVETAHGLQRLKESLSGKDGAAATWKQVEEMLGISRWTRTRIVKTLDLCPEALRLVAEYDLKEGTIRPIVSKLTNHGQETLQVEALQKVIALQANEEELSGMAIVEAIVEQLLTASQPKARDSSSSSSATRNQDTAILQKRIASVLNIFNKLSSSEIKEMAVAIKESEEARAQIQLLREQIDAILD